MKNRNKLSFVFLSIIVVSIIFCFIGNTYSATKSFAYVSNLKGTQVFVIDLNTKNVIKTITTSSHSGFMPYINDIRLYRNECYLSIPGDFDFGLVNKVKVIEVDSNAVVDSISTNNAPSGMAVYNDKVYVLNRYSNSIHEINPTTHAIIRTITFSTSYPNPPIFLEIINDKIYLPCPGSGGSAGGLEVLNLTTGAKIKSIGFDSLDKYGPIGIKKVGSNKLYVGAQGDVAVINTAIDSLVKIIHVKDKTTGYVFSFTTFGNKVYSANADGTCSIFDAFADTLMKFILVGYCSSCSYFNVDVAASDSKVYMAIPDRGVKIIDPNTDTAIDSIATPDYVGAMDILEQRFINILSINDVPNDQGKQVQVVWQKFVGENDAVNPVRQYGVWRLDNLPPGKSFTSLNSFDEIGKYLKDIKPGNMFSVVGEVWTFAGWSPVSGLDNYSLVVPTLFDSTITGGMHWSKFKVSGHSADFSLQAWSNVDSGYSVDNLVPHPPLAFSAKIVPSIVQLTWEPPSDPDINYYAIYRGTTPGFDFENTAPIATTTATFYNDSDLGNGSLFYYVLRAFDFSGNKGKTTSLMVEWLDVNDNKQLPDKFALYQNHPNPFNPSTSISYDIPFESRVTLKVYNLIGKIVATLTEGVETAGYKSTQWNPSNITSGVYYYRLDAVSLNDASKSFTQMRKMLLLK